MCEGGGGMKLQLGVLFGGASVEHEISIISAIQAMNHLDQDRYHVIPIYIAKDHQLYHSSMLTDVKNFRDLDQLCAKLTPVAFYRKGNQCVLKSSSLFHKDIVIDLVLPIMHGTFGEDGTLQGYLRMLKIPFCACELSAAVLGQDKELMKQILEAHQLPIVPWFAVEKNKLDEASLIKQCDEIGWPLIIKPASLGSSVGIHVAATVDQLNEGLADAFQYDSHVVIEHAVTQMREFNCALIGDEEEVTLSCIEEVLKGDEILSYKDKYEGNGKSKGIVSTGRKIPADLSIEQQEIIEILARKAFHALRGFGIARIDFLMDSETQDIYINEINTIPGSLSFYLFEPKGIAFAQLLDQLIQLTLKRQRKQAQMICSYATNVLSAYSGGSKMIK